MIDSQSESIITFSQATDELPRRRRGRKTHVSTLHRWATAGCRGVVLETLNIGATRCTSREALQRFFERLTAVSTDGASDPSNRARRPALRSAVRRRRDSERAAQQLEAMGA